MLLHDAEAEIPFEASFDARFPYDDETAASALIKRGWRISLNAAFCVLHELSRPPHQESVSKERLRQLLTEWTAGPDHPLKAPVLRAAKILTEDEALDWREGAELMRRVGTYDGQRAALALVHFASDCDSPEGDKALSALDAEIREHWDERGV
jgi:hypothetical protein